MLILTNLRRYIYILYLTYPIGGDGEVVQRCVLSYRIELGSWRKIWRKVSKAEKELEINIKHGRGEIGGIKKKEKKKKTR